MSVRGWGGIEDLLEGIFLPDERNLRRSDFNDSNLFKAKNSLLWIMTCVSKEYEIKTKMEQEQWVQLKMLFLWGYSLKTVA